MTVELQKKKQAPLNRESHLSLYCISLTPCSIHGFRAHKTFPFFKYIKTLLQAGCFFWSYWFLHGMIAQPTRAVIRHTAYCTGWSLNRPVQCHTSYCILHTAQARDEHANHTVQQISAVNPALQTRHSYHKRLVILTTYKKPITLFALPYVLPYRPLRDHTDFSPWSRAPIIPKKTQSAFYPTVPIYSTQIEVSTINLHV